MTDVNSTTFRFENLLHLRECIRDQKKNELLVLLNSRVKILDEKSELEQTIEELQDRRRQSQKEGPIDMSEQIQYSNHLDWLKKKRTELLNQLNSIDKYIEEKRSELEAAMQEVKIMENLREKDEEKKEEQVRRSENNQMDELQINRRNL